MKKILLFLSIIGLIALTSCRDEKSNNKTSNTKIDTTTEIDTSESEENTSTTTDNNNTSSNTSNSDVYDDTLSYEPFI